MITAGVYARKSTDEGDKAADAKSVARQVQRAREYAAKRGWRFDEKFIFTDDGVSRAEFRNRQEAQGVPDLLQLPPLREGAVPEHQAAARGAGSTTPAYGCGRTWSCDGLPLRRLSRTADRGGVRRSRRGYAWCVWDQLLRIVLYAPHYTGKPQKNLTSDRSLRIAL